MSEQEAGLPTVDSIRATDQKSVVLLEKNPLRKQAMFYNASEHVMFLNLGGDADMRTNWVVKLKPDAYYELPLQGAPDEPVYPGKICAIWDGKGGHCQVTEIQ